MLHDSPGNFLQTMAQPRVIDAPECHAGNNNIPYLDPVNMQLPRASAKDKTKHHGSFLLWV